MKALLEYLWSALQAAWNEIELFLGLERDIEHVNSAQMVLRTILVYALAVTLVRIGSKRFLSQATAFDVIVAIMLGSILSRAINGSAPLVPTILASVALVGLHGFLAFLAIRTGFPGRLLKGERRLLIKDGEVQEEELREAKISRKDLEQALHLQSKQTDPAKIRRAYLERNGKISVIPYEKEPQILEVAAEQGVQTIRIKLK